MWISIRAKNLIQVGLASANIFSKAELKVAISQKMIFSISFHRKVHICIPRRTQKIVKIFKLFIEFTN